ncbi:MAG: GDSL-type esterase/lipase family protein [Peptoniphilaceae bacterium]|nr:GDSL-type esterase/lipase family protein [Peptoniphilaceae bacterium]MDY6019330.1 GDSL-type esterase/lipase family protein [Anaerococcus sp.]
MRITCLGDSFTEGFLVNKNYTRFLKQAGFQVENLGINGNMTGQMLERVPKKDLDIFIVFGGTNDFYAGISAEVAYENIKSILKKAKAKLKLVIIPPYVEVEETYPLYKMINDKIDDLADKLYKDRYNIVDSRFIIPQFIDGTHMGETFHQNLAKEIKNKIKGLYV